MSYVPNHHRRRSLRLPGYDYSSAGAYFVTIVVKNRDCVFGSIVEGEMQLNEIGEVVREVWDMLPVRYPGVETDAFVVMPNHVHGIIVITDDDPAGEIHESHAQLLQQERRRMLLGKSMNRTHSCYSRNGGGCCCQKSLVISR